MAGRAPLADRMPPGLARPAQRALAAGGFTSLRALAAATGDEVASLHGMGPDALNLLRGALAAEGLRFRAP